MADRRYPIDPTPLLEAARWLAAEHGTTVEDEIDGLCDLLTGEAEPVALCYPRHGP